MTNEVTIWESKDKVDEIRKIFCKDLTPSEFDTFLAIGRATGLNPFLRELWAIKYNGKQAAIFIGRDGYRRAAQDNPDYDYHYSDAVYANDSFEMKNGVVSHSYKLNDRGQLIGAYAVAKRKNSSMPVFTFVELKEYTSIVSQIWKQKPATMIKKVAEAQVLRMSFQKLFAMTYDESENWKVKEDTKVTEVEPIQPDEDIIKQNTHE